MENIDIIISPDYFKFSLWWYIVNAQGIVDTTNIDSDLFPSLFDVERWEMMQLQDLSRVMFPFFVIVVIGASVVPLTVIFFSLLNKLFIPVSLDSFLLAIVHPTLAAFLCTWPIAA